MPLSAIRSSSIAVSAALAFILPAAAHIMLAQPVAPAGSTYAGYFRVGHGCDGKATVKLRVEIPEEVSNARAQPKAGWTVDVERAALKAPVTVEGKQVSDRVAAISWSGRLEADQFDEFGVLMKLPKSGTRVFFPTMQTCDGAEARWVDIPADGQSPHDLKFPAPMLTLVAAVEDPMAGMPGMGGEQPEAGQGAPAVTAGALAISAVSLPEVPGGTAALYLTVTNTGPADRLTGGRSDLATAVEVHSMSMTGGTMEMRKIDALDVPTGGTVVFDPNGNHIMLIGLKAPLRTGMTGTVTLTFEHQGDVAVPVTVTPRGAGGAPDHEH